MPKALKLAKSVPPSEYCNAQTRSHRLCRKTAGWSTDHPGRGRCRLHGGATPIKHGRYSGITRDSIRQLIEKHEADPNPLDIFPELAAARALFEDFINRYDRWREAILAWWESYSVKQRPLSEEKILAFESIIEDYEDETGGKDATDRQLEAIADARSFLAALRKPWDGGKPREVLDISDAYRIVTEITKIAERIEKIRAANAISRPNMLRMMAEMGRVVEAHVRDEETRQKIQRDWLSIRVA